MGVRSQKTAPGQASRTLRRMCDDAAEAKQVYRRPCPSRPAITLPAGRERKSALMEVACISMCPGVTSYAGLLCTARERWKAQCAKGLRDLGASATMPPVPAIAPPQLPRPPCQGSC
ncbi:hypothetical protein HPB50_024257 [Hyalomma asiaticum]|uniref:Uncharacterized protein n=1 Tax=Hyalomma asiaticum TaxID=266040 RepID=A0ACB7S9V2_HYAAI|nr:hypothetical protein HPB50_024257 [Hyalomma asiaticum]